MNNICFYIPFSYAISTRLLSISKFALITWLMEYLVPLSTILLFIRPVNWHLFLVGLVAVYNLYEIGYIQNDCETIKKENEPTKRLSHENLTYYERNKWVVYFIRGVIAVFISFVIYKYFVVSDVKVKLFLLWVILPIYCVYNSYRTKWSFFLITMLTSWRYMMPMILSTYNVSFILVLYLYILYPFPTFLQQCVLGKFGVTIKIVKKYIISDFSKRYLFRVKYYTLLVIIVSVLILFGFIPNWIIIVPVYYLVMRLFLFEINER